MRDQPSYVTTSIWQNGSSHQRGKLYCNTHSNACIMRRSNNASLVLLSDPMIVYISRGLLSSLTEAKDVLNTIAVENGRLQNRVTINTYVVIDGMQFLCLLTILRIP